MMFVWPGQGNRVQPCPESICFGCSCPGPGEGSGCGVGCVLAGHSGLVWGVWGVGGTCSVLRSTALQQ